MAQNVRILPYTSENKISFSEKFWGFTYKNALPAAYLMKPSINRIKFWFTRSKIPFHLPLYKWERISFLTGAAVKKLWIFEKSGCKKVLIYPYTSEKQPSQNFFEKLFKNQLWKRLYLSGYIWGIFFQIIPKITCENAKIQPLYKWGLLFKSIPNRGEQTWSTPPNHTANIKERTNTWQK